MATTTARAATLLRTPGIVLGIGLGGFVDGSCYISYSNGTTC